MRKLSLNVVEYQSGGECSGGFRGALCTSLPRPQRGKFSKIWQILYVGALPGTVDIPSYGESWISRCRGSFCLELGRFNIP